MAARPLSRLRLPCAVALVVLLAAPALAHAEISIGGAVGAGAQGAAMRLPIEPPVYDAAVRCTPRAKPGMTALVDWLDRNVAGTSWGTYRCEKWGKRSASLHAENRAVDWHLDASRPADRREANRLIGLLLAPDKAGNPQALARRMGVEEIIWDCFYWGAGMAWPRRYSVCLTKSGRISRTVDKTTAHRDHVHIGMSRAGAAKRTSFWTKR